MFSLLFFYPNKPEDLIQYNFSFLRAARVLKGVMQTKVSLGTLLSNQS